MVLECNSMYKLYDYINKSKWSMPSWGVYTQMHKIVQVRPRQCTFYMEHLRLATKPLQLRTDNYHFTFSFL